MRFVSLTLQRYGNYESGKICFDPRPGVVNLLLAPNSAGKSVLRTAVTDLLFGIHNQTPMGFRFGYPGMRMMAEIERNDGARMVFSRRKTRGNVLTDAEDQPIDPGFLHGLLSGRDRAFLERLFVLDTEALRGGGQALLETGGDVASALLSAAGGVRQARLLKQQLEKQRDDLAPVRKVASRPFYQALDALQNARTRFRAATLRPDDWVRRQKDLEALEDRQRAHNAEAEAALADVSRLERIRRVRDALTRHAQALAWLDAHPDVPALPPVLGQNLLAARLDLAARESASARARIALEKAREDAETVRVDTRILSHADQIERLTAEAAAARKAQQELPGVRGQYENSLARTADLLRELGLAMPAVRAAETLPTRLLRARAGKAIQDGAGIASSLSEAVARVEKTTREIGEIDRQLTGMPAPPDTRALESLVEVIRAEGAPAARRADAEKNVAETVESLKAIHARVAGWAGTAEQLIALRPLSPDAYREQADAMATAREEANNAARRHEHEEARSEQARVALRAMGRDGDALDEGALRRSREKRDALWRLIHARIAGAESLPAVVSGEPIDAWFESAARFESAMTDADEIADRRFRDAALIARLDSARITAADAERRAMTSREFHDLAEKQHREARVAWSRICAPLYLMNDPSPADVQTFLSARDQVIAASERHGVALAAHASLSRRHASWAFSLRAHLDEAPSDLMVLLNAAGHVIAAARETRKKYESLVEQRERVAREARDAVLAHAAHETRLAEWTGKWQDILLALGRPEKEEPVETEEVLRALDDIAGEYAAGTRLVERMEGMNADIERFVQDTRALSEIVGAEAAPGDAFDVARGLGHCLTRERAQEQRERVLREGVETGEGNVEVSEKASWVARSDLQTILTLIGAETIEDAEKRLALSGERIGYEKERDRALATLRDAGDGLTTDALRAEVAAVPSVEVITRIEAATVARREAAAAAQRIAEEVSALRQSLDQSVTETAIHAAAADQQAAVAWLSRSLNDGLLYHTASLMLGRALDIVEQSGDSALLNRLGRIFETLTGGACARVVTEMTDGGAAHLAFIQRDFPEERQTISQLSEGTRDQFFLALRVAAIEDHLESMEPLPFVGDDILQTFDDERAAAALRVLADLSRHTQVIVLTHHRHVMDLADRLAPGTIFPCRIEHAAAA